MSVRYSIKRISLLLAFALLTSCSTKKASTEIIIIDSVCYRKVDALPPQLLPVFKLKSEEEILSKINSNGFKVKDTNVLAPPKCDSVQNNLDGKLIFIPVNTKTIWGTNVYLYFSEGVLVAVNSVEIPQK